MQLYLIGSKRILCNIAIMKSEKDNPLKELHEFGRSIMCTMSCNT